MLYTKFHGSQFLGSREEDFYLWAWWPSWPTDWSHLHKLSYPQAQEVKYEMLLKLAQGLLQRHLKHKFINLETKVREHLLT